MLYEDDSDRLSTEYGPDVIKTKLPHSAFGHRECRGCLNAFLAADGADGADIAATNAVRSFARLPCPRLNGRLLRCNSRSTHRDPRSKRIPWPRQYPPAEIPLWFSPHARPLSARVMAAILAGC